VATVVAVCALALSSCNSASSTQSTSPETPESPTNGDSTSTAPPETTTTPSTSVGLPDCDLSSIDCPELAAAFAAAADCQTIFDLVVTAFDVHSDQVLSSEVSPDWMVAADLRYTELGCPVVGL
jgi:hypothetical protein